jgi:hypothetical protein
MIHAIRVHEHGGPEKLVWEEIPKPGPKPGEALVRHEAVGLNYIDVYFRTGLYKAPSMPVVIGMEWGRACPPCSRATAWPTPARSAPTRRRAASPPSGW